MAENPYSSDAPYDIVVKELAGNVDCLARADVAELVDTEAAGCLVELMAAQTRLDAAIAKLASRVERSGVWRGDGSRSASAWLERRTGRHRGECRTAMRRGKHLAVLSEVAAAFENGRIGAWHVDQFARPHRRYPTQVTHDQARFVACAHELDHDGFAQVLAYWRHAVDPDGVEHDATAGYQRRRLDLSDGISPDEADHFNSYRELLFPDNEQELGMGAMQDVLVQVGTDPDTGDPIFATVTVGPSMSVAGANASGLFFDRFDAGQSHDGYLSPAEKRLIAEWLDVGAQYYNSPFDVPIN